MYSGLGGCGVVGGLRGGDFYRTHIYYPLLKLLLCTRNAQTFESRFMLQDGVQTKPRNLCQSVYMASGLQIYKFMQTNSCAQRKPQKGQPAYAALLDEPDFKVLYGIGGLRQNCFRKCTNGLGGRHKVIMPLHIKLMKDPTVFKVLSYLGGKSQMFSLNHQCD